MENQLSVRRQRYTPQQRNDFVVQFRKSGLTQAEFARRHDLKLCTLQQWLHLSLKPAKPSGFKELFLPVAALELCVGHDITLKLGSSVSPEFVAQLIQQLRSPC
jgi:transposase-like protein